MRTRFAGLAAGTVAAALCAALPATAGAALYTDHECLAPSGAPAPAGGFEGSKSGAADAGNTCGTAGGLLRVALTGTGPWQGGTGANQRYTAPAGTKIAGFDIQRSTTGLRPAGPGPGDRRSVGYRLETDTEVIDACEPGAGTCTTDVSGLVTRAGLSAAFVQFNAGCGEFFPRECGTPDGQQNLRVDVPRATFRLVDESAPTVSKVTGTLTAPDARVAGVATVEFDAGDVGGGLYRVFTIIDGQTVETRGLDQGSGTCVDANTGNADAYEFIGKVPCPLSLARATVAIDTTKLTDGEHELAVAIEDAAGNRATVLGPLKRTVANARANGTPADRAGRLRVWFAHNRRTRGTMRYGKRVVVRGRLTDRRGRGIRGAEITLQHFVGGKLRLLKTGQKTRRAGRLTVILPTNLYGDRRGLRRLRFSYTAFRPGPVTAARSLRLKVINKRGRPVTRTRR